MEEPRLHEGHDFFAEGDVNEGGEREAAVCDDGGEGESLECEGGVVGGLAAVVLPVCEADGVGVIYR